MRRWFVIAGVALLVVAILSGALVAVAEFIGARKGVAFREPLYAGGAAGFVLNLLAFPLVAKLATMPPGPQREKWFWVLWGAGFLVRMAALGGCAFVLNWLYAGFETAALLAMVGIYLPCMFVETAWLAHRFFAIDTKDLGKHG